ncbi:gypsy/ty3 retroelement polyprotein [Tanacetum coccineum]
MREEMEKLMAEMRSAVVAATASGSGMMVRPQAEAQRGMQYHRVTKIEFPRFGGEDLRGWLFRCEKFFKVDNVPNENKRFSIAYDDPLGEIKKLRQTGSVQDYIDAFDKLLCRIELHMEQTMSFFMAGLQHEIELFVRMFKPRTLAELNKASTSQNGPTRKQLTQKELEEKRAKGLYLYCDQKYAPGHKCSGQVYCLEVIVDETTESGEEVHEECLDESIPWEPGPEATMEMSPQISLNAITRVTNYKTMRVMGWVRKHELHILIDTGSTHNFLDVNNVKNIGCHIKKTCPMEVAIAGGKSLISNTMCSNFT